MSPTLVMSIMQGPLCGTLTTMMIYGIICMQTFSYSQNYQTDRVFLKLLVAGIWILESAHTALGVHFIEHYLILHFGDDTELEYAVWSMAASYIIGFVIAYVVNLCYIWRIWLLSGKRTSIACAFVLVATVRLVFGLTNCSLSYRYSAWKSFRLHVFPTLVAGWALSAVVDSAIAITLCYFLHKRRTGMRRTDSIINQLLLYSINTGGITSCFAILVIIMFLGIPDTLAFIGFVQVQSKLYAVSLLATLNTRKNIAANARLAAPTGENIHLTTFTEASPRAHVSFKKRHHHEMRQNMDTVSDETEDVNDSDKPLPHHLYNDGEARNSLRHSSTVNGLMEKAVMSGDDEAPFG